MNVTNLVLNHWKKNCIGRESDPGLPRTANLLLLAGENSTTEPPMLGYSCQDCSAIVKYIATTWIIFHVF